MVVTESQIAIVKSTVPILKTSGEVLTTHFYKMMFRDYPEVKALFNQTHQVSGAQPRALANSVLAYAENIDALQNLGPVASQIVSKHVALQILPHHYPIVGTCLIRAIREVLGEETATQEVLDAWAAAYQQLADILIGAEAKVYKTLAEAKGGWAGARRFVVARKVRESDCIVSFCLSPEDGKEVLTYLPGQYIGLQLFVPSAESATGTQEVRRNYSLSQAADGKSLRISVKREPSGVVSNLLHDTVKEGDVLNVFPPSGDFTLKQTTKPIVLLSAGVGITPTLAMLQHAAKVPETSPEVRFVHFARSPDAQAFAKDVEQISAQSPATITHHFQYTGGMASVLSADDHSFANLDAWMPKTTDINVYLLGPAGFMRNMRRALIAKGVPASQIAFEFFGPTGTLE